MDQPDSIYKKCPELANLQGQKGNQWLLGKWGRGEEVGTQGLTANGYGVSFIKDENVLKLVNKHNNNKNSDDTEGWGGVWWGGVWWEGGTRGRGYLYAYS